MHPTTTMTSRSFEQSINHVNYAVGLIGTGKYSDAINELTLSLSSFKECMAQASIDEEGSEEECPPPRTSFDQCMKQSCSASSSTSMIVDADDDDEQDTQEEFLYKQAITIPHFENQSYCEGVLVSCMIIFNLAVAYHLHGLSDQTNDDNGRSSLARALRLYQLSFNLQREHEFDNNILFTLAIVNNLGLCHSQLHDEESSIKCFEHVLSTLMYLTDCGEASRSHLNGFFVNVTKIMSEPCGAPAA